MNTKYELTAANSNIVYVKPIASADLPAEVQAQTGGVETVYAVHNADGEQLALVADQRMAFVLARQNNMAPVQVH